MSLVYGIHAVTEALRAGRTRVERVCAERGRSSPRVQEVIDESRRLGIQVSFEDRAWLDRKCGGARHQGILCYLAEADTLDPEDVLSAAASPGLLLVLDGVEDPHNLGAILRSAETSGVDGVFVPERRSSGLTPAAVKASAGAAAHLRIARVTNISRLLADLQGRGYWTVGLDAGAKKTIWQADLTMPVALVLGSEGTGLHRLVRERCDFLVSIPVRGKVASHNVSVAAGIALYEVVRQRAAKP